MLYGRPEKSMGNAKFRGLLAPKTLGRFSKKKFARLITLWTTPSMQILGSIGSMGACLRMREIVTLKRLFFSLFTGRHHSSAMQALYKLRSGCLSVRPSVCLSHDGIE